ncbi:UNVERIFIED_CONTAM: hypothetical protein O8I53_11470 [Campylobacter lari]
MKNLMVFNTINSNGILKTHRTAKKDGLYAKLLKLNGNDIFKYDNHQQEALLSNLANSLGNISNAVNIIKINNKTEFKENLMSVNEKLVKYQDNDSQKYLKAKYDDIDSLKNQDFQEYYLLVFGDNEFDLSENVQNVKYAFESAHFILYEQSQVETVLFFNNFYGLGKSYGDIELAILNANDINEVSLFDVLDYKTVVFQKTYFKLNDKYFSMQAINEFDYEVENG